MVCQRTIYVTLLLLLLPLVLLPSLPAGIPSLQAATCAPDGDVNQDGGLTPVDTLLTLQHYLGLEVLPDPCQQDRANVEAPATSGLTPADARCIFRGFLSQPSCLDNVAPLAVAGPAQQVNVGALVLLDGSNSIDINGHPLTYRWRLTTRPEGSMASLSDVAAVTPSFVADQSGAYVVELMVNNGSRDSTPDTVTITAASVACVPETLQACYEGPAATVQVGLCRAGTRTCSANGLFGPCDGQVLPAPEIADNGLDEDCDLSVHHTYDVAGAGRCISGMATNAAPQLWVRSLPRGQGRTSAALREMAAWRPRPS